jgi:hypothetical protein
MFPPAEPLMNDAEHLRQALLVQALAPPCLLYKISSGLFTSWVESEEGDDGGPLRDDRLSFVTFPTFVNLTQGAELLCNIFLPQIQQQPSISKVLAKSLWLSDGAFLSENESFKCFEARPNREKAKWQNGVIRISREIPKA